MAHPPPLDTVGQTRCALSNRSTLCVTGANAVHCLSLGIAYLGTILCIEISVGIHTAHVVHGRSHRSFDAHVHSRSVQPNATEATDTDDADALHIHIGLSGKEIHRRTEIFCYSKLNVYFLTDENPCSAKASATCS